MKRSWFFTLWLQRHYDCKLIDTSVCSDPEEDSRVLGLLHLCFKPFPFRMPDLNVGASGDFSPLVLK